MARLNQLIQYWKDRLSSFPAWGKGQERGAIRDTITYLSKLQTIKGGKK